MARSDGVAFGSPFTREGLRPVAVITLTTSAHQTSLLAAAAVAPVLLFALVVGVRLDRIGDALFSSPPILWLAVVLLLAPIAFWLGFLRLEVLIFCGFGFRSATFSSELSSPSGGPWPAAWGWCAWSADVFDKVERVALTPQAHIFGPRCGD